jgi:hypothetical protein
MSEDSATAARPKPPIVRDIHSWTDFNEVVAGADYRNWAFRGQSDQKWPLYSSLSRYLKDFGINPLALLGMMSGGGGLPLPEPVWTKLCVAWGVFFIFKGTLNIWVAYAFDTETWVNFKLFGGMGLMFAFVIAQAMWLSKYLPDEPAKAAAPGSGEPPSGPAK